jgi:predicted nucleic acid-binding protein
VIVVDASVLAPALSNAGPVGQRFRRRLRGERLVAPALIDLEIASAWRRAARAGRLSEQRASQALADLADLALARAPHGALMGRIWSLRDNLTAYDAAYVALAEILEAPLLTADERLVQAPTVDCEVEVLR